MSVVHVVVPEGVDDPMRDSGGNVYDRRLCAALVAGGWTVQQHPVVGAWPRPDQAAQRALTRQLAALPDDATVLVDGLVASAVPQVLVPAADRLRLVVLVHLPLGVAAGPGMEAQGERAVLSAAADVLVTSDWTRRWVVRHCGIAPDRVQVAVPGTDPADLVEGSPSGHRLLCVAAVTAAKGHDTVVAALAALADVPWRWVCVGSLTRDRGFVDGVARQAQAWGIDDRVEFTGPRAGPDLAASYAAADLLVLASRAETYGMVVTEALARGLPVVATAVGGIPEALGQGTDGEPPGLLVPPDDPAALAAALRSWLEDADLRRSLRRHAEERRRSLPSWSATAARVERVLAGVGR